MRSLIRVLLGLPTIVWLRAAVTTQADGTIANDLVRVTPIREAGLCVGLQATVAGEPLAVIRLGPRSAIAAATATAEVRGDRASLRLTGLRTPPGVARFAADSAITVTVEAGPPWPRISFDLGLEAFDPVAWQTAVGGTVPFHLLLCELPGASMFYQGGGMIPLPEVDPFPFTAKGFMAGEWAPGWSYAPALAGWAVPAVGLWHHVAKTFVAYDFAEQRHGDRSGEALASAGFIGNGGPPFFCLVHPYQAQWVKLTYPAVPSRVASHFELVYTRDLPAPRDPNQFVLERWWREKRDLLPPVPRMNDLAWIPEYDGFAPSGGIQPTAVGIGLVGYSGTTGLEGAFVEVGSTMLGNDFIADGILRARTLRSDESLEPLKQDLAYLMERCTWLEVEGDRCAVWRHPMEGRFREEWGGERCAGIHHTSTFQIGAGMLRLYQVNRDGRLLPYIDGVYRWCRHYLFTRNGVCDLPWAMFSREATAVGENFLLTYRQVFRDDPERNRNADEALELARTAVYKTLWMYTADPDPTDDLDPTFLNQATNDVRWAGRVTWNEAGWVLRTMVPLYCETGDAFLKYLLRGSAERYYAGFRDDGGIAENLQIVGEVEAKGLRTGGFPDAQHGGILRRWARPLAPAVLRVAMGQRAAIAFCLGTRSYDVGEYRYAPEANFSFRLVGSASAPANQAIDLVATAPFRDLRGLTVAVNGQPLPPERYELNGATAGEDVFIRGVRPGDVVQIGAAPAGPAADLDAGIPYRDGTRPAAVPWRTADLGPSCTTALPKAWWEEKAWFGLVPGRRQVWGIPVDIVDPELSGGKDAVTAGTVTIAQTAGAVFAVLGRLREGNAEALPVGRLRLDVEGAEPRVVEVREDILFDLTNGFPLRHFDTWLVALDLGGPHLLRSLTVEQGVLLALTLGDAGSPEVRQALAQAVAVRSRTLADRTRRYYQAPVAACPDDRPWFPGMAQPWRFRVRVLPETMPRGDTVLNLREDFGLLLRQVGLSRRVEPTSIRAVVTTPKGEQLPVPAQFDPLPGADGQQGELLLQLNAAGYPGGEARQFDIYFGPDALPPLGPVVTPEITPGSLTVDTGTLRFEFALDGGQGHPRWTRLAFSGADGRVDPQANVLGPSGFNGGFGEITTCTDWVTWYDNGGLQSRPARAEVVSAGPVATTVRVSGLELWGQGDAVQLGTRQDGRPFGAASAGEADWYFRFYPSLPLIEQWLDFRVASLAHGWTRPLQVRYGLNRWQLSGVREVGGRTLAFADELATEPLPEEVGTHAVQCVFTADGNVLQVAFSQPDAVGAYFTGRWLVSPSPQPATRAFLGGGVAIEQFAVEARVDDRVVKTPPTPMPLTEFDRTRGLGPGPRPEVRDVTVAEGDLNPDPSFEQREAFWALGASDMAARWSTTQVYSGKVALDLSCTERTLSLVSTNARASHALDLAPNGLYEVTFQAKCTAGEGEVHANVYSPEPGLDFPHVITPVPADGQWHRIRIEVPTGHFTPRSRDPGVFTRSQGLAPALRLWTYRKLQSTYVDQVEVRRLR